VADRAERHHQRRRFDQRAVGIAKDLGTKLADGETVPAPRSLDNWAPRLA
jgi:hypothetical protein